MTARKVSHMLLCFANGPLAFSMAPRAGAQALTPEAYNKVLNLALDEVEKRKPADARQRIQFGLNLFFAHEVWVREMPLEALLKTVDAFKEAVLAFPRPFHFHGQ
jgi:hypothetical protein